MSDVAIASAKTCLSGIHPKVELARRRLERQLSGNFGSRLNDYYKGAKLPARLASDTTASGIVRS
jgi:hypothetical protein